MFRRLEVFDALYRCGDQSVIAEVLALARRLPEDAERMYACEILARHPPVRVALGLSADFDGTIWDENLFLQAVDEWHREVVLHRPSPYRPPAAAFTGPFARAKQSAWNALEKQCRAGNDAYSHLRVWPADAAISESDRRRPLTLISGYGHGHGIGVVRMVAGSDRVRCFRFAYDGRADRATVSATVLPVEDLGALRAGLCTIAAAKLTDWWAGPELGFGSSTADFAAAIYGAGGGAGGRDGIAFVGYPGSGERGQYLKPRVALDWAGGYLEQRVTFSAHRATAGDVAELEAALAQARAADGGPGEVGWVGQRLQRMLQLLREALR